MTRFTQDLISNSMGFFPTSKTIKKGLKPAKTKQCLKNVYPRYPSATA